MSDAYPTNKIPFCDRSTTIRDRTFGRQILNTQKKKTYIVTNGHLDSQHGSYRLLSAGRTSEKQDKQDKKTRQTRQRRQSH